MARDIGQRLLNDPEDDELGVVGKSANVIGNIEVDLNAAPLLEAFHIITQGEAETGFVEIGRMQKIGDGAELAT